MTNKMQQCRVIYCSLADLHGQGTVNYPTMLPFVGHFCILYFDARNNEYQVCLLLFAN